MPRQWQVIGQAYQSMTYGITNEIGKNMVGYALRYTDSITKASGKDADYRYLILLDN